MANEVVIKISGDIANYKEALEKSLEATEDLQGALGDVAKGSAIAFAALTAEVGLSVAAFNESNTASLKLTNSMQNAGIYSKRLEDAYKSQANAIQDLTGVDGDAIVAATALMQAQIGNIEITQELQQAVVDLAAARDLDAESAADLISKGINGQITGLQKLGFQIDENATKQQRLSQITQQVSQRFGGTAAAANEGSLGLKGFGEVISDIQENIGSKFAPLIKELVNTLTGFAKLVRDSETFTNFIAGAIAAGTAITGMITVVTGAATAFLTLRAAVVALGVSTTAALGPIGLIGAALGVAAGAMGYYAASQVTGASAMEQTAEKAEKLRNKIRELELLTNNGKNFDFFAIKDLEAARTELAGIEESMRRMATVQREQQAQDPTKAAEARRAQLDAELALQQEHDLKMLEQEAATIQLRAQMESGDQLQRTEALISFYDSEISRATEKEDRIRLMREKNNLLLLKGQQEYNQKSLEAQAKTDKQREDDQRSTLNTISTLQNSNNQALAIAGKAAALVQIAIDGPMAVTRALAAFPPPFNFAAATAVGAAVAAQAARVVGVQFAEGGMMTGGVPGTDSIPAMYMPGELVVPTKNFDEVVGAVQTQRSGQGGGVAVVEIRLMDQLMDFIEARLVERQSLGISLVRG